MVFVWRKTLEKKLVFLANFIDKLPEKPILIGQSLGELAVHKLTTINKGVAGICTHPSQRILTEYWKF
jgi:hypothetical protein